MSSKRADWIRLAITAILFAVILFVYITVVKADSHTYTIVFSDGCRL